MDKAVDAWLGKRVAEGKRVLHVGLDAWTSDLAQQGKTDRTPHARPAEDSASAPGINVSQSEKEQCKL